MLYTKSALRHQLGAANGPMLIGVSLIIIVIVIGTIASLRNNADTEEATVASNESSMQGPAEPPPIKTVDMQATAVEAVAKTAPTMPATQKSRNDEMFARDQGRVLPLKDGLAGGSEASNKPAAPASVANAVDAFDFGVLDGRVRIGVFGKSSIPDYRATVSKNEYLIEMPGQFQYVEEFSRTLKIEQFGVLSARIARDARGMNLRIAVSSDLAHEPFLIEDPHGLMVAFEPRRVATP